MRWSIFLTSSLGATAAVSARSQAPASQIFGYHNATFLENLAVGHDDRIFLSSLSTPNLIAIDPSASSKPVHICTIANASSLLGSAFVAPNVLAIHAGIADPASFSLVNHSAAIWEVDLRTVPATTRKVAAIRNTRMLNGMASLPVYPHIVLSLDSIGGRIFRTNTRTGAVDVAVKNKLLGPDKDPDNVPLGANGIKIRGNQLYFTNSALGFFGRFRISSSGDKIGKIEKLHSIEDPSLNNAYDDFDLDSQGNAYVSYHPNRIVKISPNGEQSRLAGGASSKVHFYQPTSVALSHDEKTAFVTTGGASKMINGKFVGGQVIAVGLE